MIDEDKIFYLKDRLQYVIRSLVSENESVDPNLTQAIVATRNALEALEAFEAKVIADEFKAQGIFLEGLNSGSDS